jgi:hypothetical protein
VPGRDVSIRGVAHQRRNPRRVLGWVATALALLAIGIAIGSRIASPPESSPPVADTTSAPATGNRATPARPKPAPATRTPAGAVAAATRSITAFDGDVLLEPLRLRAVVQSIASTASRTRLIEAFNQAGAQTRAKLGADTAPRPVIVLRSIPIGYRVERFSADAATVAVWYLGIVGSGATVQPQQSWRTQIVTLAWEGSAWKVGSFESSAGPTPPLSAADVAEAPGELFAAIPRFEEFERVEP